MLELIYEYGRYGVQMFWAISGFVFAHVYLDQLNKISSKDFLINRFARLYPLHWLALFIIAGLQILNFKINGNFQIYQGNDLYHFILNFFYIHAWGLAKDASFNGPTWSVSIELIVYFIFFISISSLNRFKIKFVLIIYLILLLIDKYWETKTFYTTALFDSLRLFFSGIMIYYLYSKINNKLYLFLISIILIFISLLGNFKLFIFFPAIILFFAVLGSTKNKKLGNFFQFSGDLTYALYLLHVPTQIMIILFFGYFDFKEDIFYSEYFFLGYVSFVIFISSLSFKFFEKPLNYKIRKIFRKKNNI
jgi:peptidoglycan/LPS O-acetylase OafA/YrhL